MSSPSYKRWCYLHTNTHAREENHSYFKMFSFVIYYCDKQVFLMRTGINIGFYLTPGGKGNTFNDDDWGNQEKRNNYTEKRTFHSLLGNNMAESSMLIPEETACIHPSIHPTVVQSVTRLKIQRRKPVVLELRDTSFTFNLKSQVWLQKKRKENPNEKSAEGKSLATLTDLWCKKNRRHI